jgi:hypothetical protein
LTADFFCPESRKSIKMDQREFNNRVMAEMAEYLGEGCSTDVRKVSKNNGIVLDGMIIRKTGRAVSPTVYLNGFYEEYQEGVSFADVMERIIDAYNTHEIPEFSADFFGDYSKVKTRILYKLINAEKNKEMLEDVPHILWNDLAIVFYYSFPKGEMENATILIRNSNTKMWKVSVDDLRKCSEKNMPELAPDEMVPMSELLEGMLGESSGQDSLLTAENPGDGRVPMYVLSNRERLYGASAMLYSHRIEALADDIDRNLYILPSSVHEVIILPDEGEGDPEYLVNTIKEVNETQVEPDEVLSDKLYYFDRMTQHITVISA